MIGRRNSGSDEASIRNDKVEGEGIITECSTISERHSSNHSINQGSGQRCSKERGDKGREIGESDGCDGEVIRWS